MTWTPSQESFSPKQPTAHQAGREHYVVEAVLLAQGRDDGANQGPPALIPRPRGNPRVAPPLPAVGTLRFAVGTLRSIECQIGDPGMETPSGFDGGRLRRSTARIVPCISMSVVIRPSALTSFQVSNLWAFADVATEIAISPSLTSPPLAPCSVWVVRFRKQATYQRAAREGTVPRLSTPQTFFENAKTLSTTCTSKLLVSVHTHRLRAKTRGSSAARVTKVCREVAIIVRRFDHEKCARASFAASKPRPCNACTPESWPHALYEYFSFASKSGTNAQRGGGRWLDIQRRRQCSETPTNRPRALPTSGKRSLAARRCMVRLASQQLFNLTTSGPSSMRSSA